LKIPIKLIESVTGYKVKKNFTVVGLDTAKRTGVAVLKSSKTHVNIETSFVDFDNNNNSLRYKQMVTVFEDLFGDQDLAVIENVFVGFNAGGSLELALYGAFAISACIRKDVPYIRVRPTTSRAKLGIKTSLKAGYGKGKAKLAVGDWLRDNLQIDLDDDDASDAIVLGLIGILEDMDLEPAPKKKKKK
jgi:Holliday junction resolvasome RuvABC endonuclease subunit